MKRARIGIIAAAVFAVASVAFAQAKPDFSGTWTLDAAASNIGAPGGGGGGGGMMTGPLTIKVAGDVLTIDRMQGEAKVTTTLNLAGQPTENQIAGRQGTTTTGKYVSKWDGRQARDDDHQRGPQRPGDAHRDALARRLDAGCRDEPHGSRRRAGDHQARLQEEHVEKEAGGRRQTRFVSKGRQEPLPLASFVSRIRISPPVSPISPRPSADSCNSSHTFKPVTGSTRSGATSASGPSTKKRSRNRGCGTWRPGESSSVSPRRIRSRSRVRAAPGNGRSRP